MENAEVKIEQQKPAKAERWFAGYIVAGFVWYLGQGFNKNQYDGVIILVVAVLCGVFYRRIKARIKGREWLRIVGTFLIIELIAGALIGFSTALANRWQDVAVRTPFGADIAKKDGEILTQLNRDLQTYFTGFQGQWDAAQNSIDEKNESRAVYSTNVSSYRTLLKLNNERYARFVSYSDQVKSILSKYSQNLMDAFSQMATAAENTKDAYNDVFETKISYYQSLLDGQSEAEINSKLSASNDAIARFNQEQQTATQAQSNWQKAYNDFFGK